MDIIWLMHYRLMVCILLLAACQKPAEQSKTTTTEIQEDTPVPEPIKVPPVPIVSKAEEPVVPTKPVAPARNPTPPAHEVQPNPKPQPLSKPTTTPTQNTAIEKVKKSCLAAIKADQKQDVALDTEMIEASKQLPQNTADGWVWDVKVKNNIGSFQYICTVKGDRVELQLPFAP